MNEPEQDLEPALRAMRWRQASPEFLQRSLDAVLEEGKAVRTEEARAQQRKPKAARLSTLLNLVPRPIRWPLAACWLLSLFFRLSTPDPVPASVRESLAKLPAVDPAVMLAQLDSQHRLLAELIEELHRRHDDPTAVFTPGRSPLP